MSRDDPSGGHRQGRGPDACGRGARARRSAAWLRREADRLRAERNGLSEQIGAAIQGGATPDGPEVAELRARSRRSGRASGRSTRSWRPRQPRGPAAPDPQPPDADVPVGGEGASVIVRTWGEPAPTRTEGATTARPGSEAALGGRRGARHHRQRARRQDRGLRVPGLQGRRRRAPARPHQLVPRRPYGRARLHRGLAARGRQRGVGARAPARSRTRRTRCTS